MMRSEDATTVLDALAAAGVDVWVDGGWGVDALVLGQTRHHDDLDLVVSLTDHDMAVGALQSHGGLRPSRPRPDPTPTL